MAPPRRDARRMVAEIGEQPGASTRRPAGVRLSELVAALSFSSDLGLGQPMEHVLRSCLIALRLADHLGLDDRQHTEAYWVTLLATGCTASRVRSGWPGVTPASCSGPSW
jgi:hypothetical protein